MCLLPAEHRTLTTVIGPVPCFFAKVDGWYRWQIVVRGPQPELLVDLPWQSVKQYFITQVKELGKRWFLA